LVQECGRTDGEEIVELHEFTVNKTNVEATLTFAKKSNYNYKAKEIKRIYKKLDRKLNSANFNLKLTLIFDGSSVSERTLNQEMK
jgi:hypothetical protein